MYIKRKTSPAAKFKSASLAGTEPNTHVFKALRIITNHIRFCLAYEYGINFVPIKMNVIFQETYENIN